MKYRASGVWAPGVKDRKKIDHHAGGDERQKKKIIMSDPWCICGATLIPAILFFFFLHINSIISKVAHPFLGSHFSQKMKFNLKTGVPDKI